ncbi:SET domain-containing protein-lysine N-methyltransferase [Legionella resiliens]|uniref:SET domain-containing protein-lysine N-methyltransferase n=1 Tax=Legionella resiliens TaxID=2905958 RepID=A0ABS8X0I4_9GAMM|nr:MULTISPECIES: SET domain-containing protein-lysine N-methyltransferase [unclassified Legionella]MCE0721983.1 SET domain-containing protein-lysine N-methyltransferase [Legionella sp. 9fVS26]MCE3531137.1 SET domain-containing protein-lysine N-methyltransferase [Legionella sp. 8cVS16]
MTRPVKFLNSIDREQAAEEMLTEQLVFFPEEAESQLRLCNYLKNNGSQPGFNYLSTVYDKDIVIAAAPNLGSRQLAVYAGKSFAQGEIVGEIKGIDLFGVLPDSEINQRVKKYQENSTYVWKLNLDDHDQYAVVIDLLKAGTNTRWVNHARTPNLEVKVICHQRKDQYGNTLFDYHAYYVATHRIAFGEELTISYGDDYFTKARPQIIRQPQTLIEILHELSKAQDQDLATSTISTREEIKKFFSLLTLRADMRKIEAKRQMYLDKNLDPKLYDLHVSEDVARFEKNQKMELQRNSPYHLVIAPTERGKREYRYSLFSGQKIPARKALCQLVGQQRDDVPKRNSEMHLWAMQQGIDTNYLVQTSKGGYLYTKEKASEAYCIEGAKQKSEANVRFDFKTNSYITTREIRPGEEILAFYENYDYSSSPTTLSQVVADFNESQYYYQATWNETGINMEYVIPKTPGYNLDSFEVSEPPRSTKYSEEEQKNEWVLPTGSDLDENERILTPGYNLDLFDDESPSHMGEERSIEKASILEKRKSTWSPSFQFGGNATNKKQKSSEITEDEKEENLATTTPSDRNFSNSP